LKVKVDELKDECTKTCREKDELEKKIKYIINNNEVIHFYNII
jgi:hypothetical protein